MSPSRRVRTALCTAVSLLALVGAPSIAANPITGTPEDDVLTGTPRRDTIRALAGHDDITGRRGDDRLFGEEGIDTFHWRNGDGHDRITNLPTIDLTPHAA
jgi:Ca2+-binding RTX toxin-like protein